MRGLYGTCKFPSLEKDLGLEYFDCEYSVVSEFDKCMEPQTTFLSLQRDWSLIIQDVLKVLPRQLTSASSRIQK